MSDSPHAYQRTAEALSKRGIDVTADDVEFITDGMKPENMLLDREDTKRWYSFGFDVRCAVLAEAVSHGISIDYTNKEGTTCP